MGDSFNRIGKLVGGAASAFGPLSPMIAAAARYEELCATLGAIYPEIHRSIAPWSIHLGQTTIHSTNDWLAVPWSVINEPDPYRAERAFWRLWAMVEPLPESFARLLAHAERRGSLGTITGRWLVEEVTRYQATDGTGG